MEALYDDGVEVDYTMLDGMVTVNFEGATYTGTWDGAKLVIEDTEAEKQP